MNLLEQFWRQVNEGRANSLYQTLPELKAYPTSKLRTLNAQEICEYPADSNYLSIQWGTHFRWGAQDGLISLLVLRLLMSPYFYDRPTKLLLRVSVPNSPSPCGYVTNNLNI